DYPHPPLRRPVQIRFCGDLPPNTSFGLFFFNDTATTEIYPLSLHDALPILSSKRLNVHIPVTGSCHTGASSRRDRKSTRLNSSHTVISYAVFCLKKKTK